MGSYLSASASLKQRIDDCGLVHAIPFTADKDYNAGDLLIVDECKSNVHTGNPLPLKMESPTALKKGEILDLQIPIELPDVILQALLMYKLPESWKDWKSVHEQDALKKAMSYDETVDEVVEEIEAISTREEINAADGLSVSAQARAPPKQDLRC